MQTYSRHQLDSLDRESFDQVFVAIGATTAVGGVSSSPERAWNGLRRLRKIASEKEWVLDDQQKRMLFETGVRVMELRSSREVEGNWDSSIEREKERTDYLNELWEEFRKIERTATEEERDGETMVRFANLRLRSSIAGGGNEELLLGANAFREGMGFVKRNAPPEVSPVGSAFLPPLFQLDGAEAISLLIAMLDKGRIPSRNGMLECMRQGADEVDYDFARAQLSLACGSGSRSSDLLKEISRRRLATLEERSRQEGIPKLAFIEWLVREQDHAVVSRRNQLGLAMKLWQSIFVGGELKSDLSYEILGPAGYVLGRLVEQVCEQEARRYDAPPPTPSLKLQLFDPNPHATTTPSRSPYRYPSAELITATQLAMSALPVAPLLLYAPLLLTTLSITSPSYQLARTFYEKIRTCVDPDSPVRFRWHANLLPTLYFFFRNALSTPANPSDDPRFLLQLYYDLTGQGMTLPTHLWSSLWLALGRRGSPEEISRVMTDYRDAGKQFDGEIAATVLIASADHGRVVKTLKLLKFFEERMKEVRIQIPIEAYDAVLLTLAYCTDDRRLDLIAIFSRLLTRGPTPTIDTWNALIASHVSRPIITAQDLEAFGMTYNNLITARQRPNSTTFSLLITGFLRDPSASNVASALKTFHFAIDAGILVGAGEVARLMRALGNRKQWESAKLVAEKWWRCVMLEGDDKVSEEEEKLVQDAGEQLVKWEAEEVEGKERLGKTRRNVVRK